MSASGWSLHRDFITFSLGVTFRPHRSLAFLSVMAILRQLTTPSWAANGTSPPNWFLQLQPCCFSGQVQISTSASIRWPVCPVLYRPTELFGGNGRVRRVQQLPKLQQCTDKGYSLNW